MKATHLIGKGFKNWRTRRPFWGGILCIVSGLIIIWVPSKLYEIAASPGSIIVVGFLLGGLTLLAGVLAFVMPKLSTLLGVLAIFSSVLSIMGALGGFLVGTILGIIGGSLMIAWKPLIAVKEQNQPTSHDHFAGKEVASGIDETSRS